ncbi:hypothetical protein AVEN_97460-1 [Araneus ventricosus]|uniref:Uncharacterized protein n=1 Tax=Araneus ventricosus TaxID=182803 RepID=A0A4Y2Q0M2_ARAVE|nr:hypothetical protein AVEN_97460-1 [Araneus ventricosus]
MNESLVWHFELRGQSGDSRTKNTQQQLSVPLIDGSTKNQVNSIFCYIHQMAALQLLQQRSSPNSKPMTHFIAQKPVTHFTARKVYDHFHSTKSARACAPPILLACHECNLQSNADTRQF